MAGSEAEERLRAKTEAAMRKRWPDARIVHELMLQQGGVRIDLAAVGPDFLAVAEIKSERDVLKRLADQVKRSVQVADEVWVCFAEKHAEAFRSRLLPYYVYGPPQPRKPPLTGEWRESKPNPDRIADLSRCHLFSEQDGGLAAWPDGHSGYLVDGRARFDLLWADEMRVALSRHFGGAALPGVSSKLTRGFMQRTAVEHMSGREIRRAVCAALRERHFPRADPPASMQEVTRAA